MPAVIASGNAPNSYTLTVDRPTNTQAGDLLVAFVGSDGDGITLGAPGGFVDLGGTDGVNRTVRAWYKIATNGEPAQYTFSSSSGNAYRVSIVRITGAPTSNPIAQGPAWTGQNASATSFPIPQRTAPAAGALQLAFLSYAAAGDITVTLPSGFSTPHTRTSSNISLIAGKSVSSGTTPAASFTVNSTPYNYISGSLLISSGQVVDISRSITPSKELVRGFSKTFTASIAIAGVSNRMRVVLRQFTRSITPVGDFTKDALKILSGSITPVGLSSRRANKILTASITAVGTVARSPVRVFTASITPVGALLTQNIGRLFGAPGIVDITVRLAGEIRARVRRR